MIYKRVRGWNSRRSLPLKKKILLSNHPTPWGIFANRPPTMAGYEGLARDLNQLETDKYYE